MAGEESASPLLAASEGQSSESSQVHPQAHESTPLLADSNNTPRYDGDHDDDDDLVPSPAATSLRSIQEGRHSQRSTKFNTGRWPTVVAVSVLGTVMVVIMIAAFLAPVVIDEYAKQAMVIEPTDLSIDSFTTSGVRARIQAKFRLDASKVKNPNVRNIGRFGTWIARKVESQESKVEVYLPEYGNLLLGTARVPGLVVSVRNDDTTYVDFISELNAGDLEGIRRVANDWLEGTLGTLRVQGKADVSLKSGLVPLGTQSLSQSLIFEGKDIPSLPQYNISRLNFREVQIPSGRRAMAIDVSLSLVNPYPIRLSIPPLGFDVLVPNCASTEPHLPFADATTGTIDVVPFADIGVAVGGIIRQLPESLTKACPHTRPSPLDALLGGYIHGKDSTIYVKGSNAPAVETPDWISDILSSITVPLPFPGHTLDGAVKNFSIADVNFGLPNPFADPGSPESNYRISGDIRVIAALPKEMNFGIDVSHIRATADVFFEGKKLGVLNLKEWQSANSTRLDDAESHNAALMIQSQIKDAPLNITDERVLTDVATLLLNGQGVILAIKALVDVEVESVLGKLVVRDLPGEGNVPIQAPLKGGFGDILPQVGDLQIIDTSETSIALKAKVNFTNPTPYTAQVPYINIHIISNGSIVGEATAKNVRVHKGNNTNVGIEAVWNPHKMGGRAGARIGRDLLSQYISGWNTTLTFKTHEQSVPSQPALGRALSNFSFTIPTPRLGGPPAGHHGDGDGDRGDSPQFIRDATFHLFSSTATFTLISPLQHSTLFIDRINATAFYNHTDPIGKILYALPFKVPPGATTSPRLPVVWSLDSVGYEKLKKALGGNLKLDAEATVDVSLGRWSEEIWYVGQGIGAQVRL
ncbi:MAG: regulator of (H+)-ATPase in vacuolar membrane [Claussenomyces sp. TS43310]|nr:MAG: regulator of (H+)-ATPase in vacuolar membrane [Claussenomyces sp. TS43310]